MKRELVAGREAAREAFEIANVIAAVEDGCRLGDPAEDTIFILSGHRMAGWMAALAWATWALYRPYLIHV